MSGVTKKSIGILAYGSLVEEPGAELENVIIDRIACKTPFNVEYARVSQSRGNAPTVVVPPQDGAPVAAQILVMAPEVDLDTARAMLWRREINRVGEPVTFKEPDPKDKSKVHIKVLNDFEGVEKVFYTSIFANLGTLNTPERLAYFAIQSALGEAGVNSKDGITYLKNNIKNGIITPLTGKYTAAILSGLNATDLDDALRITAELRPRNLAYLNDLKVFEEKVKTLTELVCDYGFISAFGDQFRDLPPDEAIRIFTAGYDNYWRNRNIGFGIAQKEVIALILAIQDRREELQRQLKEARTNRNKKLIALIEDELKYQEFKEDVLCHLMDTVAFQLFDGHTHISRRLYKDVEGKKQLKHSNLPSLIKAAEEINANLENFALLSDLTSYVQTGDLVVRTPHDIQFVEVKEGEHNHKLVKLAKEIRDGGGINHTTQEQHLLSDHDMRQIRRVLKQEFVLQKTTELLQNDKGWDTALGTNLTVVSPQQDLRTYTHRIYALQQQFSQRNLFANDCIEDCIHIGLSRGPLGREVPYLMELMAKAMGATNYVQFNARAAVHSLSKPLFTLPFERGLLFDILFGRQNLTLLLDFDAFINLAAKLGIALKWSTEKQLNKLQPIRRKELVVYKKRGLIVVDKDDATKETWLYWGLFIKMIFEHILPSEILKAYWALPDQGKDLPEPE